MKQLALSLLLIGASWLNADECLLTQACMSSNHTEQNGSLAILDAAKAREAATVTVTITRGNVAEEEWGKMIAFATIVYGAPTLQEENTVKFAFERGDKSADEWFNLLSNLEAIFVAVRSTVQECTENNAQVTVDFN